jgi:hypothetical protein
LCDLATMKYPAGLIQSYAPLEWGSSLGERCAEDTPTSNNDRKGEFFRHEE